MDECCGFYFEGPDELIGLMFFLIRRFTFDVLCL